MDRNLIAKRGWFKIKRNLAQMRTVAAQPERFDCRYREEQSLFTFAKAYYHGGGWWYIAGYAADGSDTLRVYDKLTKE